MRKSKMVGGKIKKRSIFKNKNKQTINKIGGSNTINKETFKLLLGSNELILTMIDNYSKQTSEIKNLKEELNSLSSKIVKKEEAEEAEAEAAETLPRTDGIVSEGGAVKFRPILVEEEDGTKNVYYREIDWSVLLPLPPFSIPGKLQQEGSVRRFNPSPFKHGDKVDIYNFKITPTFIPPLSSLNVSYFGGGSEEKKTSYREEERDIDKILRDSAERGDYEVDKLDIKLYHTLIYNKIGQAELVIEPRRYFADPPRATCPNSCRIWKMVNKE
jgi:hypothetical protein